MIREEGIRDCNIGGNDHTGVDLKDKSTDFPALGVGPCNGTRGEGVKRTHRHSNQSSMGLRFQAITCQPQTFTIFCCIGCWCQEDETVRCGFGTQLVPRVQMSWLPLVLGPVHRSTLIFNFSNIIAILISTGGWAGMDRHEQCVGHCCGKFIRSLTGTHFQGDS